jgi:molybdopterin-guanine dinucleotide biosynthesis protein A
MHARVHSKATTPPAAAITGLVLAGGAGTRVGGRDKGTLSWRGKPLAEHVCRRLRPQVSALWISCNRNLPFYTRLGDRLFTDAFPASPPHSHSSPAGPLAGLAAVSGEVSTPLLAVVACDMPRLPTDLIARLGQPLLEDPRVELCVAFDGEREHYLAALLRRSCLPSVRTYLARGERSVKGWYATLRSAHADFSDQPEGFANINRLPGLD